MKEAKKEKTPALKPEVMALLNSPDEELIENEFNKDVHEEEIEAEIKETESKSVGALFNTQNISLKTELNGKEPMLFSTGKVISQRFQINELDVWLNHVLEFKVSNERKGRREYIEGLHAQEKREQGGERSPLMNLLGLGR